MMTQPDDDYPTPLFWGVLMYAGAVAVFLAGLWWALR